MPTSFRPDRTVTFGYTATSNSGTDLPVRWRVTLFTCQDTDNDGWCEFSDANRVDHGERTLNTLGGNSQTATWGVNLASAEGTYLYHFHTACLDNPCTGTPPGGSNNRTGTFQLAYTNTWARQIIATNPTSAGTTQTVTYRLTSTSLDDRDLTGSATLHSDPPEGAEIDQGAQGYTAAANTVKNIQWPNVAFPEIGIHRLRVTDTNAADTTLDVTVRGVHLHVIQPRGTYEAGATFGLYFTFEGHGNTPDPAPIPNTDIRLTLRNGTFVLASTTLKDGRGRPRLRERHNRPRPPTTQLDCVRDGNVARHRLRPHPNRKRPAHGRRSGPRPHGEHHEHPRDP